jgi:hypothetical protein
MGETTVGKKVVHVPTGRVGVVEQQTSMGFYVKFPDGNEDFFPGEALRLVEDEQDGS